MEIIVAVLSFAVNMLFVAVSRGGIELPVALASFHQFDVVPVARSSVFFVTAIREDVPVPEPVFLAETIPFY